VASGENSEHAAHGDREQHRLAARQITTAGNNKAAAHACGVATLSSAGAGGGEHPARQAEGAPHEHARGNSPEESALREGKRYTRYGGGLPSYATAGSLPISGLSDSNALHWHMQA